MIRVLIAEDHPVAREGLLVFLDAQEDLDVVAVAENGLEAVELAERAEPDVVLMDMDMPELDGVGATRRISARPGAPAVVMLTAFSGPDWINDALDAGAGGYVLKDAEPHEVVQAVRAAAAGHAPLSPEAAAAVLAQRRDRASTEVTLSPREREVLRLVADGLSNKAIASELGISEKTVKTHLTSVFHRIGVRDRTAAAAWAHEHRVADLPVAS